MTARPVFFSGKDPNTPVLFKDLLSLANTVSDLADGTIILDTVELGNGTVSLPSMTFSSDISKGLYSSGTNKVAMSIGGSKVTEWTASGFDVTGAITATTSIGLGTNIVGVKEVDHTISITATTTAATAGGAWSITAGTAGTSGAGGAVNVTGGIGGTTGVGGAVVITSGAGGTSSGTSGAATIRTAAGATNRASGVLTLESGATVSTGSGNFVAGSGVVSTTGNSGTVVISSGSAVTGDSGAVTVKSGTATTGNSGILNLSTSNATTGNSGDVNISTGTASATTGVVNIIIGGTNTWVFNASGALNPAIDDAYVIGGTTKPRSITVSRFLGMTAVIAASADNNSLFVSDANVLSFKDHNGTISAVNLTPA